LLSVGRETTNRQLKQRERILLQEQNLYSSKILKKLFLIRFYSVNEERRRENGKDSKREQNPEMRASFEKIGREKFISNEYENSSIIN